MNKRFQIFSVLAALALFATACAAQAAQAAPNAAAYEAVLGKSLRDQVVADFIASNNCSSTGQLQLCNDAGMALWVGQDQKVELAYLYPNKTLEFAAYKGALPFALSATDTIASVEDKFGQPNVVQAPQAGWELGLPDESGTADRIHYWAVYKRFGLTIIYNSPSATDKGATIHAILVSK